MKAFQRMPSKCVKPDWHCIFTTGGSSAPSVCLPAMCAESPVFRERKIAQRVVLPAPLAPTINVQRESSGLPRAAEFRKRPVFLIETIFFSTGIYCLQERREFFDPSDHRVLRRSQISRTRHPRSAAIGSGHDLTPYFQGATGCEKPADYRVLFDLWRSVCSGMKGTGQTRPVSAPRRPATAVAQQRPLSCPAWATAAPRAVVSAC